MGNKTALVTRVYYVADKLNIPKVTVDNIVKAYLNFCKEQVYIGHRVCFQGIVSIVPKYEVYDFKVTRAYLCEEVAKLCSCTYNTVNSVIMEFLTSVKEDVLQGTPATINGLCTIKPFAENGVYCRLQTCISDPLSQRMHELGNPVRCYTEPVFKQVLIEGGVAYDRKNS